MNEWGKWCQLYLNEIDQQTINAIWGHKQNSQNSLELDILSISVKNWRSLSSHQCKDLFLDIFLDVNSSLKNKLLLRD